jgi:two-component system, chemotaxis family, sensor kinase CheA
VRELDPATRARLVALFVGEAEEGVATLRQLSARLASGPDADALAELGRTAHGLKGAAASLGYDALAGALHDLEDLALGIEGCGADARTDRLARVDAALALLAEGVVRMGASRRDEFPEDLMAALREVVGTASRTTSASTPTPTPTSTPTPTPTPTDDPTAVRPERSASAEAEARSRRASTATATATALPPPPPRPSTPEPAERINVPAADVDAALRLAATLSRGAAQLSEALHRGDGEAAAAAHALASAAASLEGIVAGLRLLPADAALSGLEEEVAALAGRLGKRAALVVTGRDVHADRRTLQAARGMIRHLVRNALDHGIEPPDDREAQAKPLDGHLAVAVEARESTLRVTVADDGAGFDRGAIRREMARRTGNPDGVASLSDEEVLRQWAFEGGSTRESATQISGRGLGLSAVAQLARAAGGGIRIQSVRGEGSVVEFTLPLEVYAVEALVVAAAGRAFAIPLPAVDRTLHLGAAGEAIHDGPAGRTLAVGETILPLGTLAEALGIACGAPVAGAGRERFAVVVRSEGALAALAVDDVGTVEGVVPSPVPGIAQADALAGGIARLSDGRGVALLNPRLLVARAREARTGVRAEARAAAPRTLDVLLAEDSLATREVLRVLLEGQGFRVRVAADGEEALQRVSERAPDVLVSDVNMPRRDGLALTRALRARAGTERLPIVLLTSQDDDAARAAGAAAGADVYLLKSSFNAAVLHDALARLGVIARAGRSEPTEPRPAPPVRLRSTGSGAQAPTPSGRTVPAMRDP